VTETVTLDQETRRFRSDGHIAPRLVWVHQLLSDRLQFLASQFSKQHFRAFSPNSNHLTLQAKERGRSVNHPTDRQLQVVAFVSRSDH
jgi:hypothetical protein